jgi:hypothetical protein
MRPESKSNYEKDSRGRSESKIADVDVDVDDSWILFDMPSEEESSEELTEDLFGDVLNKIDILFNKDKNKFDKEIKGKIYGR